MLECSALLWSGPGCLLEVLLFSNQLQWRIVQWRPGWLLVTPVISPRPTGINTSLIISSGRHPSLAIAVCGQFGTFYPRIESSRNHRGNETRTITEPILVSQSSSTDVGWDLGSGMYLVLSNNNGASLYVHIYFYKSLGVFIPTLSGMTMSSVQNRKYYWKLWP